MTIDPPSAIADTSHFVLAFGDSLTAGYGLRPDEAFPARLAAHLADVVPDVVVANAGVSGDTTISALARLPRLLAGLPRKPDLAIVELGANDLIRRIDPARTLANLDAIVGMFGARHVPVLLAGFEPPAFLGDMAAAYSGICERVAARHAVPLHPFFPPGTMGHHAHVLHDRLHPNALAIDKVAVAMAPVVARLLGFQMFELER